MISLCFPDLQASWSNRNKTDYYWTLPNGSEIWIAGLDTKDRTEKILGKEYSTIYFNECSQLDFGSVSIALTRLAEKNALVNKAYFDENPPTKRHWSYWMFIRHWHPDDECELDPEMYQAMLMNPRDNMENIDESYIKDILEKLPEKKRKRFLDGEFIDGEDGLAYYTFDRDLHVRDFSTPNGSDFVGMDFNVDPMSAVIGKIADNKIWIYDEVFLRNSDTFKMCKELRPKLKGQVHIVPDSTAKNRRTSGKSDFLILKEAFGSNAIVTSRNPFVSDRVNNVNRLLEAQELIIHPRCKKLINDLEKVSWANNELDKKSDHMLTHVSDALGYLCWKYKPFRDTSPLVIEVH